MAMYILPGSALGQAIWALSKVWLLGLPLLWWFRVDRGQFSLSPLRKGGLATGAWLGGAFGIVIVATYWGLGERLIDPQEVRIKVEKIGLGEPVPYLLVAAYLSLLNTLLEEYVWRWFVFTKCEVLVGKGA
ncbi:MAG: CPBP family intramembrane glutamate endopeptidase, partial [Planctomycetota bacterium]